MPAFGAAGSSGGSRNAKRAAALLALCVLSGCARPGRFAARRSLARNFVLLCFDTVRADSFARHDRPGAAPDAFSAWARRAVVYDDARSAAPWTLPSVASVMTGLYPARHGAGRFAQEVARLESNVSSGLPESIPTLGAAASAAGVDTAAFTSNAWVGPGAACCGGSGSWKRSRPAGSWIRPGGGSRRVRRPAESASRARTAPTAVGVFDPRTATFHLRPADGPARVLRFGRPGDLPVVGDWDGDGVDTVALWQPSSTALEWIVGFDHGKTAAAAP